MGSLIRRKIGEDIIEAFDRLICLVDDSADYDAYDEDQIELTDYLRDLEDDLLFLKQDFESRVEK